MRRSGHPPGDSSNTPATHPADGQLTKFPRHLRPGPVDASAAMLGYVSERHTGANRNPRRAADDDAAARPPVAAFFDLDKTIIARSSAYAFRKQFVESGLLTTSGMMQMALGQAMYISGGHDQDQMEAARDQLSAMVKGWRADHVRKIAEESLHQVISPYVYAEARELIRHHKLLGHDVIVISASASEIVEPVSAAIGVRECIATRLEVVDGVYTGEVSFFCRGGNKAAEMRRLAAERGYDLSRCYAYSDSATDEPMLSAVGHPVAVNPDKPLRKIAEENAWPIRLFRNPEPLFRRTAPRLTGVVGLAVGAAALAAGVFASRRNGKDS